MKFSAIIRASTLHQETSLEIQRQKITAWAFVMGHEIVEWHETLESGKRQDLRPSITKSLETISSGESNGIVITKLDRLSRSMLEIVETAEKLQELKGVLVVTEQSIDTSTAAGRFFFGTMTALAQFERDMINERCLEGIRNRKAKGMFQGMCPYGFRRDGDYLVEYEPEQEIISQMLNMQLMGLTSRQIADELNSRKPKVNGPRGGDWAHMTVYRVIKSHKIIPNLLEDINVAITISQTEGTVESVGDS